MNKGARRFRSKPKEIEAVRVIGETWHEDVFAFLPKSAYSWNPLKKDLYVQTLNGLVLVNLGDWIIRGIAGEFYPCKAAIFAQTYGEIPNKNEIADQKGDAQMENADKCSHPRLIHIVNIEDGGINSTTYRCEECDDLLTVSIKPFTIEVVYGVPDVKS